MHFAELIFSLREINFEASTVLRGKGLRLYTSFSSTWVTIADFESLH